MLGKRNAEKSQTTELAVKVLLRVPRMVSRWQPPRAAHGHSGGLHSQRGRSLEGLGARRRATGMGHVLHTPWLRTPCISLGNGSPDIPLPAQHPKDGPEAREAVCLLSYEGSKPSFWGFLAFHTASKDKSFWCGLKLCQEALGYPKREEEEEGGEAGKKHCLKLLAPPPRSQSVERKGKRSRHSAAVHLDSWQ